MRLFGKWTRLNWAKFFVISPMFSPFRLDCFSHRFKSLPSDRKATHSIIMSHKKIPVSYQQVVYVPALAFSQTTGINVHVITPVVMIICIFYTCLGGMKAVVWWVRVNCRNDIISPFKNFLFRSRSLKDGRCADNYFIRHFIDDCYQGYGACWWSRCCHRTKYEYGKNSIARFPIRSNYQALLLDTCRGRLNFLHVRNGSQSEHDTEISVGEDCQESANE